MWKLRRISLSMWLRAVCFVCCTGVGALILLLDFWCFLMQFVQNSSYNYLGALASFTPIVIIFGYRLTGISAELSSRTIRAGEDGGDQSIGILVAVRHQQLCCGLSAASDLLRSEVMVSVESFKQAVGNIDGDIRPAGARRRRPCNSSEWKQRAASSRSAAGERRGAEAAGEEEQKAQAHVAAAELQIEMLEKARS